MSETMTELYRATDDEMEFAIGWHGGQASMLYAVASTGGLSFGTYRPRWSANEPMTDGEWARHLVGKLRAELDECGPCDDHDHDVKLAWEFRLQRLAADLEELV